MDIDTGQVNFDKMQGIVPAIIQDRSSGKILMLGFQNTEALKKTIDTGHVWFYSRTKQRLWEKGETTGHFLKVRSIALDCDQDTVLIQADPDGPVCHTGSETCFASDQGHALAFLNHLEDVIRTRQSADPESSYTAQLFARGIPQMSRKVGEEATELIVEAMRGTDARVLEEAADLLFHFLVLLQSRGQKLSDVITILESRHK